MAIKDGLHVFLLADMWKMLVHKDVSSLFSCSMIDVLAALNFQHVLQGNGSGKLNRTDVTFQIHIVNKTNTDDLII